MATYKAALIGLHLLHDEMQLRLPGGCNHHSYKCIPSIWFWNNGVLSFFPFSDKNDRELGPLNAPATEFDPKVIIDSDENLGANFMKEK